MLSTFFDNINNIYPVTSSLKETLEKELEILEYPAKHTLLREGQRCDHVYIVLKGLLRAYYIKDDAEICSRFMEEDRIVISVNSFYTRKPGYEFIETLEPSTLARIHYDRLQQIYRDYIEFNFIARSLTEHYFTESEQRLYLLRKQTAEERYLFFMQNNSSLMQRVPLKYIATYLGMNLETLSRIRKKIAG